MKIVSRIQINKSPKEVFAFLEEPKNNKKWQLGCQKSKILSETKTGVGTKTHHFYTDKNRSFVIEEEILEFSKDKFRLVRWTHPFLEATIQQSIEASKEFSELACESNIRFKHPLWKIFGPLFKLHFKRKQGQDYQRLKRVLEK